MHCQLLLALKNLIKFFLNLAFMGFWWWFLVRRVSVGFVAAVIVIAVGFLILRTLVAVAPLSISIGVYVSL